MQFEVLLRLPSIRTIVAIHFFTIIVSVRGQSTEESVQWRNLMKQSSLFLGIQHGFRLATEPGTRANLGGPFLKGYYNSLASLHGWSDGDPFYVNYVGHPMQGAVTGFIWAQNDGRYRKLEFGNNADYWRSRARATVFSWIYSTQFEIGPLSEASIGKIQSRYPQQGFVDHAATPVIGLAWQVTEDFLDRFVIRRFEDRVTNHWARMMMRGWLNPSRSFANMMRGKEPWHRDSRAGIYAYRRNPASDPPPTQEAKRNFPQLPRFELNTAQQYYLSRGPNRALHCVGGGGTAQWNVTSARAWIIDIGGCKMLSQNQNFSGDILLYQAGFRFTDRAGRWQPFIQILAGGKRVTLDEVLPDKKAALEAQISPRPLGYEYHPQWTRVHQANGAALSLGCGLDLLLSRAVSWRIASVELSHTWLPRTGITAYRSGARVAMGLTMRFGNW